MSLWFKFLSLFMPVFDLNRVVDVELDGIDFEDYPDFCDAYVCKAYYEKKDGSFRELTEEEYDIVNDDKEFVYSHIQGAVETAIDNAHDSHKNA